MMHESASVQKIRNPYPAHLASHWRAEDGTRVIVRPIRPEDADIEREFVHSLSPEARYFRFMGSMKGLSPAMLARFTQIDYGSEMALIAVVNEATRERQIGVARYSTNMDGKSAEFAIVVAEPWQRHGLGRHLMLKLIDIARAQGLSTLVGQVLAANPQMLELAAALGFVIENDDLWVKSVRLVL